MPFIADESLKVLESEFHSQLQSNRQHVENKVHHAESKKNKNKSRVKEKQISSIHKLYQLLIDINKRLQAAKEKNTIDKHIPDLTKNVHSCLGDLEKNPEIWSYLFKGSEGREALLYILSITLAEESPDLALCKKINTLLHENAVQEESGISVSNQPENKKYKSLIAACELINDLKVSSQITNYQKQLVEFATLLFSLDDERYQFSDLSHSFLKNTAENIVIKLQLTLLASIRNLVNVIQSFRLNKHHNELVTIFNKAIMRLAIVLGVDTARLSELKKTLGYGFTSAELSPLLNEKKEEKSVKTFKRHPLLLAVQDYFKKSLNALAKNVEMNSLIPVRIDKFFLNDAQKKGLDVSTKKIIELFEKMSEIIRLSQEGKNLNQLKIENASILSAFILDVDSFLSDLCINHAEIWNKLISHADGRNAIYYFICINYIHDLFKDRGSVIWLDTFLNDLSYEKEINILEFLRYIINIEDGEAEELSLGDVFNIKNPLIKAYKISHINGECDIKIQALEMLSKIESGLDEGVLDCVKTLIQCSIAEAVFLGMNENHHTENRFSLVIEELVEKQYVPKVLSTTRLPQRDGLINEFFSRFGLFQYLSIVASNYNISYHFFSNRINMKVTSLLKMTICFYDKVKDFKIDERVLRQLSINALDYIKLTDSSVLNALDETLWSSSGRLFAYSSDSYEFIKEFNEAINAIYHNGYEDCVMILLANFSIALSNKFDKEKNKKITDYHLLLSIFYLIKTLPEYDINVCKDNEVIESMVGDFVTLLKNVGAVKYEFKNLARFFHDNVKDMQVSFRLQLVEKINPLKSMILFLHSLNKNHESLMRLCDVVQQLVNVLGINQIGFSNFIDELGYTRTSEEKESTQVQSAFSPHPYLTAVEECISLHFKNIAENVKEMHSARPAFPDRPAEVVVDDNNKVLIDFLNQIINLLELADGVKNSKKTTTELASFLNVLHEKIHYLKDSHPVLWDYVLKNAVCRDLMYYLLFTHIVSVNRDQEMARFLIKNLSDSRVIEVNFDSDPATCPIEESVVLEYFEFILDKLYGIPNSNMMDQALELQNDLIIVYRCFDFVTSNIVDLNRKKQLFSEKVIALGSLISTPLIFNKKVPVFIVQLIQSMFADKYYNEVLSHGYETNLYSSLTSQLAETHYFPSVLKILNGHGLSDVLLSGYNLSLFYGVIISQYALTSCSNSTLLNNYHDSMVYRIVLLFENINQLDATPTFVIKRLAYYACVLICIDAIENDMRDKFIQMLVKMLSLAGKLDFHNEANKIVGELVSNKHTDSAKLVLDYFIKMLNHSEKKQYIDLISLIQFIIDVRMDDGSDTFSVDAANIDKYFENHNKSFLEILNKIETNQYHFDSLMNNIFLSSKHPKLVEHYKSELAQQMKLKSKFFKLYSKRKNYFVFQKTVLQVARILDLNDSLLKQVKSDIGFADVINFDDPIFDQEKKPSSSEKNKASNDKKKGKKNENLKPLTVNSVSDVSAESVVAADARTSDLEFVSVPTTMQVLPSVSLSPVPVTISLTDCLSHDAKDNRDGEWEVVKQKPKQKAPEPVKSQKRDVNKKINVTKARNEVPLVKPVLNARQSLFNPVRSSLPIRNAPVKLKSPQAESKTVQVLSPTLQLNSLFKPSTDENEKLWVSRDRLPEELLEFSAFIEKLIGQPLIVAGGAVASFILNDKRHDIDGLVFYDLEKLFELLKANMDQNKYNCMIVGKDFPIIKVLILQECICDCELIFMQSPPNTDLSNLSIKSDAAYIRTPKTIFYVNKVTQTCVDILTLHDGSSRSSVNKTMLKSFDKEMRPGSVGRILTIAELHHINSITGYPHAKILETDVSCYKSPDYQLNKTSAELLKALEVVLGERDFKVAALYMELTSDQVAYKIKGFNGAVESVLHGQISAVNPVALFRELRDLIRIFRLVKIKCKYPHFDMDFDLKTILAKTDFNLFFDSFIFKDPDTPENITHLRRINTKLNDLFCKFDPEFVLKMLCELKIVKGMAGIDEYEPLLKTAKAFSDYIKTVPNAYKKNAFYYFIDAHFRFHPDSKHKFKLLDKARETLEPKSEAPEFDAHLSFIKRSTSNRMLPPNLCNQFSPSSEFSRMILEIKLYYKNNPAPESKVEVRLTV